MLLKSTSGGGQAIGTRELDAGSNHVLDACGTFGCFGVTWCRYRSIWGTHRARIDAARLGTSLCKRVSGRSSGRLIVIGSCRACSETEDNSAPGREPQSQIRMQKAYGTGEQQTCESYSER